MKKIAVFDFDGTLTTKDTLLEFIKFACGARKFYIGFLLFSPMMVLMKLHLYPNWRCKQLFFSYFFKGTPYNEFQQKGMDFAEVVRKIESLSIVDKLKKHIADGVTVYVISASIDEWVRPYCMTLGVKDVICTKVEINKEGQLTGRFLTKNCYGREKVYRLLAVEPERTSYYLYAYGDSRGDKEMIEFADIVNCHREIL